MAFKNIKRDSLLILFVQLATWSFAYGLPVKEEDRWITFDWDQFTWIPRYTTPKPFDWDQFTSLRRRTTPTPFDWDQFTWFRRLTTPTPFDWDRFTLPKFTWFPRYTTRKSYIWDRVTLSPYDYKPRTSSTPEPFVWIIVGGVILVGLLATLIKYACSAYDSSSSTSYDSRPTLHPPPATTIRPVDRHVQLIPENRPGDTPFGGGLFILPPSTTLEGIPPNHPTTRNASSMYGAIDKPPDYSEVVISDFVGENKKFKEVSPKPLDAPPPKYGDQNSQRY